MKIWSKQLVTEQTFKIWVITFKTLARKISIIRLSFSHVKQKGMKIESTDPKKKKNQRVTKTLLRKAGVTLRKWSGKCKDLASVFFSRPL